MADSLSARDKLDNLNPNSLSDGSESASEGDEQGEAGEEDEYVVEKILKHLYDEAQEGFTYEVKWAGWAETTWEPLENLEDTEELAKYHKSIGGPPKPPQPSKQGRVVAKASSGKKRKLIDEDVPHLKASNSSTRTSNQARTNMSTFADRDWEAEIVEIETVEQDFEAGYIVGYVRWRTGERTKHTLATLNKKCPQQMLRFYEAHLQFTHVA